MDHLIVGQIVHCKSISDFEILTDGFVAVLDGEIIKVGNRSDLEQWLETNQSFSAPLTSLTASQFLMPGFVDCHIHAPQMPNLGLGLDMELLDWLREYTFPLEAQYDDATFAQNVYEKVVKRTLSNGTTLASYFATNHKQGSVILAREALRQGQRSFVGKVSSNCCSPSYYVESTENSLEANREFITEVLAFQSHLVQPIVTPRFAISCDFVLMKQLAELAKEHDLHVQSHISESLSEIHAVQDSYNCSYAAAYDSAGLLTNKTIMAHGVHLADEELRLIRDMGTSIAHCPTSNNNLKSGLCDVRRLLSYGIRVGLGTDVSGGSSPSILTAIKDALDVSAAMAFIKHQTVHGMAKCGVTLEESYRPLDYKEALFLATLGGAEALSVDHIVGNFCEGKEFDALLVDVDVAGGPIDKFEGNALDKNVTANQKLLQMVQQFVYVGDDRNILNVFVQGRKVKA